MANEELSDRDKLRADAYMKLYQEHCTHGRHHELQRSAVVTAIIAVAAAVTGLVTYDRAINPSDLPLTVFLIAIGALGSAFAMKHYERFELHMKRARGYRGELDKMIGNVLDPVKTKADADQKKEHGILVKVRLHYWWLSMGLAIAILGVVLSGIALLAPQKACP
jgi:hypothetical protein